MKRFTTALALVSLTSAFSLVCLTGCGATPTAPTVKKPTAAASKTSAASAAKSAAAVADKGLLGMFKVAHAHLDADGDGSLTAEEFAVAAEDDVLPGLPAFAAIDTNGDGAISLAEFTAKKLLAGKSALFIERAAAEFAELDLNQNKSLSKAEMADSGINFTTADADKNAKVTPTEFAAAMAVALATPQK